MCVRVVKAIHGRGMLYPRLLGIVYVVPDEQRLPTVPYFHVRLQVAPDLSAMIANEHHRWCHAWQSLIA